jgi:hypothetical protein
MWFCCSCNWDARTDNLTNDSPGTSINTVLEKVLYEYNTFFETLTNKIIELLNSYDEDNKFEVTYPPSDLKVNNTQYFFN